MNNSNVAVFGEAIIDLIVQPDGLLRPLIGGSPFNVARSFAKQALQSHYLSPLSSDYYGQQIRSFAEREAIILANEKTSDFPTSLAVIITDDKGIPDYSLYRQGIADLDIDQQQLRASIPADLSLFHTGSLALVPEMSSTLTPILADLKAKGVAISIDVNMRKGVVDSITEYQTSVLTMTKFADFVKVSDEDLELLGFAGTPQEAAAKLLAQLDNGIVVLTLGEGGAEIHSNAGVISQPIYSPVTFGDTVGAGDTFFSAFLAQLIRRDLSREDQVLLEALQFGLMAATMNVERVGCQPPTEAEVQQRLQQV